MPRWSWPALGFVLLAVALEVAGGQLANTPVPAWTERLAPIAWPAPARVVWWLAVAAAAAAYRYGERVAGIHRNPLVVALSVLPFVVFAAGVAAGADFATWH